MIKAIEDDIFKIGSIKNAPQFTKSLLHVADYLQMKYNKEVGKAIRMLEKPKFIYQEMPKGKMEKSKDGTEVKKIKQDEGVHAAENGRE